MTFSVSNLPKDFNKEALVHYLHFWEARVQKTSQIAQYKALLKYKFTNAYRIEDRSSQRFYRFVQSNSKFSLNIEDVLFRTFISIHFHNSKNFLNALLHYEELKPSTYNESAFSAYLEEVKQSQKLFTGAYSILPLPGDKNKAQSLCRKFGFLAKALNQNKIDFRTTESLFTTLKEIPSVGDFIASQTVFNMEWVYQDYYLNPLFELGIGAKRGAWKLGVADWSTRDLLENLIFIWELKLPHCLLVINGKVIKPQPADIQNTLCEWDKAARILMPENTKKGYPRARKLKSYKPTSGEFKKRYPDFWHR